MRSTNFSGLVALASLLAREALSAPLEKRALVVVTDNVIVTEVRTVTKEADGSYETGDAFAIGTATIYGSPAVDTTAAIVSSASVQDPVVSTTATPEVSGAVFHEVSSTSTPASTTTEATIAPVISTIPSVAVPTVVVPSVTVAVPTTLASVVVSVTSAASSSSTSSSTSSGNKRGLAYNSVSLLSGFTGSGSKVSWCYNWGSTSGGTVPSSLEYVPMLWGLGSHATNWQTTAQTAINNGAKALLSFNEPDLAAQSNLSPADAATGYLANMQPFAGKAQLGAPAVTNGGSPMGLTWLKSFLTSCSSCTIDFVPIHWYDSASNFAYFKNYIADAHAAAGGRDIWITEFGASGTTAEQNVFLEEAVAYLDGLDYVKRYAYFMVEEGVLVSGGVPSLLGKTFAGLS